MFEAARITDPISHTSALAGFLVGAIIGIALIAAVAFATFTCGFGVALLAGLAAGVGASAILSLSESIGKMFSSPAGVIATGSMNVFANSLASAYATVSTVACSMHPPAPVVADGSGNVFINSLPAARKSDAIVCGAKIDGGSDNVFIGGGTVRYKEVADEVPAWLRTTVDWAFALAGLVGGLAGLVKAAGGLSKALLPCAAKFIGGFIIGEAVGRYVISPVVSRVMGGLFGKPVEVATGRKILLAQDEIDFVVQSPLPLAGARFYASNLTWEGSLGRGWVLPWDLRLQQRDGKIWYSDGQGRETGFPLVQPGHTAFSESEQCYLACSADGQYILYTLNETYFDFGHLDLASDNIAWLRRVEDRSAQWISYQRDDAGRVETIRSSGGQQLRLHYSALPARLTMVECTEGGTLGALVRYGYDGAGQLLSVTDANGDLSRQFTWADGLMTSHTTALGLVSSYTWAEVEGQPRVVACRSSEGEHTEFRYDVAGRQSWATDELGRSAHWVYDENFQIVACTDLDGGSYRMHYNAAGQPLLIELPGERTIAFEYDQSGRIVAETDPLGRVTHTAYDGNSLRVSQLTTADGKRWSAHYDYLGRLLSSTDPLGREARQEYPPGLSPYPVLRIDARGGRKFLAWNRRGLLTSYTDCSGKTTQYAYDADGLLAEAIDPMGQRTRIERMRSGEPVRVTLPDGSVEAFEYNAAGHLVERRHGAERVNQWVRNARGQVLEAIDPAQRRLRYRYDVKGRVVAMEAGSDAHYRFEYDSADRLAREIRPDGMERLLRYDAAGSLVEIEKIGAPLPAQAERPRRSTRFERDKMGRLLARLTDSATTRYAWDQQDRLLGGARVPTDAGAALGVLASTVNFDYDDAGRLVAEHGAEGAVGYAFDELDNLTTLNLPHGQRIDTLTYGAGHVHQIRSEQHVISDFERDDLHREVQRTQGRLTQRMGYDALGRRAWQASGLHADSVGQEQGRLWRNYRYTPAGELAEQRDNLRGSIDFQYDPAGQLQRETRSAEQRQEQFAWDAAGNLLDDIGARSRGQVEGNRLRMWQDIRFDYDAWGNVATKRKGAHQVQRFTFDAEDRLIKVSTESLRGLVEMRFDYDPLGRRIASTETRTDTRGITQAERKRFVWQGLRMAQEVRERGVSSYVYSPDAAYTPLARIDAVIGGAMAAAAIDNARQGTRVFHFHTDLVGAPLEVTDDAGEIAWAGKYKAWGKVDEGEDAALVARIDQPLRFPGQYEDHGTGLHYNTFRYYDPDVGRYISQDPIGLDGGANLYAYAPNPSGWMDPLGWIHETAPGYHVYELWAPGATKPYYVGITDDLKRRAGEHRESGRMTDTATMKPIVEDVTYGKARGIEQANIEVKGTKTGTVGFELKDAVNYDQRGNKIASFDHDNLTRDRTRQAYFEAEYKAEKARLGSTDSGGGSKGSGGC
ncbi:DUF6531 domain-containing protein [Massilia sp. DJPM01]|uniref:RHS repeat-associated core domain-containing protein n=1 Tax=Massilia sp. DJPM01 TaxID=3024404 RepID=UPI00259EA49E|nr:RHS repeat-associated core domain-containing protein [Massilia sp. DJPM01]MDM5181661.1 DUF6531 domain-containing protein [Massilia sp. DJPM01]